MTKSITALRQAREAMGLSQSGIAERCGVSKQAVSAWELGVAVPSRSARMLLAATLLVPASVIDSWFERKAA